MSRDRLEKLQRRLASNRWTYRFILCCLPIIILGMFRVLEVTAVEWWRVRTYASASGLCAAIFSLGSIVYLFWALRRLRREHLRLDADYREELEKPFERLELQQRSPR